MCLAEWILSKLRYLLFEKYSVATKTWHKVTGMPDKRENFCVCAFMDSLHVIGGINFSVKKTHYD